MMSRGAFRLLQTLFLVSILLLCCAVVALAQAPAQRASTEAAPKPDHFDLNEVDRSLNPCVDFFQYACKKWTAENPIPPDQAAWGHGAKLALWNQYVLRDVLEKASNNDPGRKAVDREIGDYYAACMDEKAIETAGATPLKDLASDRLLQVDVQEKQNRITEIFDKYNLLALPVVDESRKLTGVITADDIISVLRQK